MLSRCLRRDREKKSVVGCVRKAAEETKGLNTPPGWNLLHKWGSKQWKANNKKQSEHGRIETEPCEASAKAARDIS
jgi:hypothetical protein